MGIPSDLYDRYNMVKGWHQARWPEKPVPEFPGDATDPNAVINCIDQMLAPLQERAPTRIVTIQEPLVLDEKVVEEARKAMEAAQKASDGQSRQS